MTNPLDPPDGNWWDQPINRRETMWLGLASVWSLAIFGWMSGFTRFGDQNPVGETFEVDPAEYNAAFQEYQEEAGRTSVRAIREGRAPDEDERQNVLVPPGDSVYLIGRQFDWGGMPVVLEAGREYDIHLGSRDVQHGFSIRPEGSLSQQINLQIFPDTEWIIPMTFEDPDTYHAICNEFCGQGHAGMHDELYVVSSDMYDTVVGE